MAEFRTLFIAGAGLSANAGLPLASDFATELLNIAGLKLDGPSNLLAAFLRCFVHDIFGQPETAPAEQWPPLEDIFTFVDLSANTGHHLGPQWSAAKLRTVRRALIARSMRMMTYAYNRRVRDPDSAFRRFDEFVQCTRLDQTAFLSMNWDVALEQRFQTLRRVKSVDYGCGAISAQFKNRKIQERALDPGETLFLFKPHGSFNWTYCDTCRTTFWVPPSQVGSVANQIFRGSDWAVVHSVTGRKLAHETTSTSCPRCSSDGLGTRLATFSYRKALDFPMYSSSWRSAEQALVDSENWVFVGYSLPPADYEFKLLLKRVQLARAKAPQITLITYGREAAANYRKLFGSLCLPTANVFENGLSAAALARLRADGVLNV